jgi:hypothetical protein
MMSVQLILTTSHNKRLMKHINFERKKILSKNINIEIESSTVRFKNLMVPAGVEDRSEHTYQCCSNNSS